MGVKEDIKILLIQSNWKLKELVDEMKKRTGLNYSSPMLSQKLSRENLHYKEAKIIADILGYDLKFEKKNSN